MTSTTSQTTSVDLNAPFSADVLQAYVKVGGSSCASPLRSYSGYKRLGLLRISRFRILVVNLGARIATVRSVSISEVNFLLLEFICAATAMFNFQSFRLELPPRFH